MDDLDRKILRLLQVDCTASVADIAKQVGLSASPCWKRIRRLEEIGVIQKRVALLDPVPLGFGLTVFVSVKTGEHSAEWLATFAEKVVAMPEVVAFHRMAGDVDYLLQVVARDMQAFDLFYKSLIESTGLSDVTSRFSMETIKDTRALPL